MLTSLIEKSVVQPEIGIVGIQLDKFYRITLDLKDFNKRHWREFTEVPDEDNDESLEFATDNTLFWHLINNQNYYEPEAGDEFDENCCPSKYQKAISVLDHKEIGFSGEVHKMYGMITRTSPDNRLMLSAFVLSQGDTVHSFQMYLNVPLHLIPKLEKELKSPKAPKFSSKTTTKKIVPLTNAERLVYNVFLPSLVFTETNDQIQLN